VDEDVHARDHAREFVAVELAAEHRIGQPLLELSP